MRRTVITICLCLLLTLGFVGCNKDSADPSVDETPLPVSIETKMTTWKGYRCMTPAEFKEHDGRSKVFTSFSESEGQTNGFEELNYYVCSAEAYSNWDESPFCKEHIDLLLSVCSIAGSDLNITDHFSANAGNGVTCYNLFDADSEIYFSFAKPYSDEQEALIMVGLSSKKEGTDIFNVLAASEAALDIKADPSSINDLQVRRIEQDVFTVYMIEGEAYAQIDDPGISTTLEDYDYIGSSEDDVQVYRQKENKEIVLVIDPDHDKPIIAERFD